MKVSSWPSPSGRIIQREHPVHQRYSESIVAITRQDLILADPKNRIEHVVRSRDLPGKDPTPEAHENQFREMVGKSACSLLCQRFVS